MKWAATKQSRLSLTDPTVDCNVEAEIDFRDGTPMCVTVRVDGKSVFRAAYESYGMSVAVPEPPKMVKRFKLSGQLFKLPVSELFEHKFEAEAREAELSASISSLDYALMVEEVQVPEEESNV